MAHATRLVHNAKILKEKYKQNQEYQNILTIFASCFFINILALNIDTLHCVIVCFSFWVCSYFTNVKLAFNWTHVKEATFAIDQHSLQSILLCLFSFLFFYSFSFYYSMKLSSLSFFKFTVIFYFWQYQLAVLNADEHDFYSRNLCKKYQKTPKKIHR